MSMEGAYIGYIFTHNLDLTSLYEVVNYYHDENHKYGMYFMINGRVFGEHKYEFINYDSQRDEKLYNNEISPHFIQALNDLNKIGYEDNQNDIDNLIKKLRTYEYQGKQVDGSKYYEELFDETISYYTDKRAGFENVQYIVLPIADNSKIINYEGIGFKRFLSQYIHYIVHDDMHYVAMDENTVFLKNFMTRYFQDLKHDMEEFIVIKNLNKRKSRRTSIGYSKERATIGRNTVKRRAGKKSSEKIDDDKLSLKTTHGKVCESITNVYNDVLQNDNEIFGYCKAGDPHTRCKTNAQDLASETNAVYKFIVIRSDFFKQMTQAGFIYDPALARYGEDVDLFDRLQQTISDKYTLKKSKKYYIGKSTNLKSIEYDKIREKAPNYYRYVLMIMHVHNKVFDKAIRKIVYKIDHSNISMIFPIDQSLSFYPLTFPAKLSEVNGYIKSYTIGNIITDRCFIYPWFDNIGSHNKNKSDNLDWEKDHYLYDIYKIKFVQKYNAGDNRDILRVLNEVSNENSKFNILYEPNLSIYQRGGMWPNNDMELNTTQPIVEPPRHDEEMILNNAGPAALSIEPSPLDMEPPPVPVALHTNPPSSVLSPVHNNSSDTDNICGSKHAAYYNFKFGTYEKFMNFTKFNLCNDILNKIILPTGIKLNFIPFNLRKIYHDKGSDSNRTADLNLELITKPDDSKYPIYPKIEQEIIDNKLHCYIDILAITYRICYYGEKAFQQLRDLGFNHSYFDNIVTAEDISKIPDITYNHVGGRRKIKSHKKKSTKKTKAKKQLKSRRKFKSKGKSKRKYRKTKRN